MNHQPHPRFTQALWYAWGQQDAGVGTDVDADQFAINHAHAAEQMDAGKATFLPSIQSAWLDYIARHSHVQIHVAPIADEVRDFLAKAIDDSLMADLDAIDDGSTR